MKVAHPLLAFTGAISSGKTTAANLLVGSGFASLVKVSFADPIKAMASILTTEQNKEARPPELCGKSLREVYQTLGTEWGRNMVGGELWLRAAARRINTLRGQMDRDMLDGIVIDDVRFDNEAQLIRSAGGYIVSISRPGLVRDTHESERGVTPHLIDFTILNDGSVEDFKEQVFKLFDS